jgi:hypothetical protein
MIRDGASDGESSRRRVAVASTRGACATQNGPRGRGKQKAGQRELSGFVRLRQRLLNCALPFRYSLSLGFFRFQGLNGITEPPKSFSLSRRPTPRNLTSEI